MRSSTRKQHLKQLHELQIRREQVQAAIEAIERLERSWAAHASPIQSGSVRSTIESGAC